MLNRNGRIAIAFGLAVIFAGAIWWREKAPEVAAIPTPPAATALPRLIDLGSDKCIPCKMMMPILEELGKEYRDQFIVEVIDVRREPALAEQYGVRIIPTQVFYDAEGEECFRHQGFMSKEQILAKWDELGISIKRLAQDG